MIKVIKEYEDNDDTFVDYDGKIVTASTPQSIMWYHFGIYLGREFTKGDSSVKKKGCL